tara:strand:+ start:6833 stop:7957 length:1125 start_codon:yes stop_codon:yes gene_type:complete
MVLKYSTALILFFALLMHSALLAQGDGKKITSIEIKAIPGLQFDKVRFSVAPGAEVMLTVTNSDEDMPHNMLITMPNSREVVVNAAQQLAEKGPEMNFIPNSPSVLWSIPVIYSGESKTIQFKAPEEPGIYPYVCTYPGHGFIMYGYMYVTENGIMPALENDENIPPLRRTENKNLQDSESAAMHHHPKLHPYENVPPYLYRVFIEGSSLASIAVHLPNQLSYAWDAELCQLQFAWQGEFLDNTDLWHGHKNAYAKVLGEIFYREKIELPIRIGSRENIPSPEFLRYKLIDGYPEFHYLLSGVEVHEIIHPNKEGSGLIRTIRISDAKEPVWFLFNADGQVEYAFSKGEIEEGALKLSPDEAKEFTITVTKSEQ